MINDKINGVMYGVAVGDALGGPVEFYTADAIKAKYGVLKDMVGGGWLDLAPGEVTDDTQMSLAVAEGILENPENPIPAIGRNFIDWYTQGPKDVGNTCALSIRAAMAINQSPIRQDWMDASLRTHNMLGGKSAGNGSLMRTAYVGTYYTNENEIVGKAATISKMTHYDELATTSCIAYSLMIHRMLAIDEIDTCMDIFTRMAKTRGLGDAMEPNFIPSPTGFVLDSFKAAAHCIKYSNSFEEAVIKAVNLGGDADTIGAITGGLAGAIYGYNAIPIRWLNALDEHTQRKIMVLNEEARKQHA